MKQKGTDRQTDRQTDIQLQPVNHSSNSVGHDGPRVYAEQTDIMRQKETDRQTDRPSTEACENTIIMASDLIVPESMLDRQTY